MSKDMREALENLLVLAEATWITPSGICEAPLGNGKVCGTLDGHLPWCPLELARNALDKDSA